MLFPWHRAMIFLMLVVSFEVTNEEKVPEKFEYPEKCLRHDDTATCMNPKICRPKESLDDCYAMVDKTVDKSKSKSLEEKREFWVHCSFQASLLYRERVRCFDLCQTDPQQQICKRGAKGCGSLIKDPDVNFLFQDSCGGIEDNKERTACAKRGIKKYCKRLYEPYKTIHDDITLKNLKSLNLSFAQDTVKKQKEAQENLTSDCVKEDADLGKAYSTCYPITAVEKTSPNVPCFYGAIINYTQSVCEKQIKDFNETEELGGQPKGEAVERKRYCEDHANRLICRTLCSSKTEVLLCMDKCLKSEESKTTITRCEASIKNYTDCLKKENCPTPVPNKCSSMCFYEARYYECSEHCKAIALPGNEIRKKCLELCNSTYSYSTAVEKCKDDSSTDLVFANIWNPGMYMTPRECMDTKCGLESGETVAKCIQTNCLKLNDSEVEVACEENPRRYDVLQYCFSAPPYLPDKYLEEFTRPEIWEATYKALADCERNMEKLESTPKDGRCKENFHYSFVRTRCEVLCHTRYLTEAEKDSGCPEIPQPEVLELTNFANCKWKLDFAPSKTPDKLWAHYFNERKASDVQERLRKPNTLQFLNKTVVDDSEGYFIFPYFIIVREDCEEGYSESFYRLILDGGYPLLTLEYNSINNREKIVTTMKIKFRTALINVNESINSDDILPKKSNSSRCHKDFCYPAFAAPLVILHAPIIDVVVSADDVFEELSAALYVSSFHSRIIAGQGQLQIANEEVITSAHNFFPSYRIPPSGDPVINAYDICFRDKNCSIVELFDEEFAPLTSEDFISPQYTFGNAPVVVFAGFYRPNLLILGDPDMTKFTLFEWMKEMYAENDTVFENQIGQCIFAQKADRKNKTKKIGGRPMYSYLDFFDLHFPISNYRVGYDSESYNYLNGTSRAIYDVISMEDRLLLVTIHGLVTLYGSTYDTVLTDKIWKSVEEDKMRECFKFVRSAQTSMMTNDVIVGVTYGEETENGKQKVFVGELVVSGKPLVWHEIKSQSKVGADESGSGQMSEIENLCWKGYKEIIGTDANDTTGCPGWCSALDATPVPAKEGTIQILIRMGILLADHKFKSQDICTDAQNSNKFSFFYIIASYTVNNRGGSSSSGAKFSSDWTIDNLIYRSPCIVDHKEAVQTVFSIHGSQEETSSILSKGCTPHKFSGAEMNKKEGFVYLARMTYTRMISGHMYLYGAQLYHSSDGGLTIGILDGFPNVKEDAVKLKKMFPDKKGIEKVEIANEFTIHRIIVMTFDKDGHFAFLTNWRELWYGSTGEFSMLRLRPSPGYSMTQTVVSNIQGLKDAIPFSVMFDAHGNLFEMVSVVSNGVVTRILKRPVLVAQILQNNHLVKLLEKTSIDFMNSSTTTTTDDGSSNIKAVQQLRNISTFSYKVGEWELFCPYSSPTIKENFTEKHKRDQIFFLRPPVQHPSWGENFTFQSLMAFQASTFGVVHRSLIDPKDEPYSRVGRDPVDVWQDEKNTASRIGYLNWILGDYKDHGIFIDPESNKRDFSENSSGSVRYFFLDYGITVKYEMEFSIKNDDSFAKTDYTNQNIALIQLNVDNANGSLLKINTEKIRREATASVRFAVYMTLEPESGLPQSLPGRNIFQIPVVFHLIGALGKCFQGSGKSIDNSISIVVMAGCLQSTKIMFDWNSTLRSIKFRDRKALYGRGDGCYKGELACFFARQPLIPHFEIFDSASQTYSPYRGMYTMRIVAGGYDRNSMTEYTSEEQDAYNIPGISDVSLIWIEWNKNENENDTSKSHNDVVREARLTAGKSQIKWACHTLSPCARIAPTIWGESVYWFRVVVSNKNVDTETLCLHELTFDLLLYGIPPSPEIQLLVTILFCVFLLSLLYLLYYCCKAHNKVWRASKIKMYGWVQIAIDTFPKPLRDLTTSSNTEEQAIRKAYIIGSIQGHLNIPDLSEKTMKELEKGGQEAWAKDKTQQQNLNEVNFDQESLRSETSSIVLPAVNPRTGAGTWTDLVYEQIITRRLQAMVEKNKQMRESILKKVDLSRMKESLEHEERFQSERGTKASEETAYQPPKPKLPKRKLPPTKQQDAKMPST